MAPLMRANKGLWVGWPGCSDEAPVHSLLRDLGHDLDYELLPVVLTEEDVELFYRGFCNQTIWPLFHDLLGHCSFDIEKWHRYIDVNRRYAEVVAPHADQDSFVWIHDYQLLLVGQFLREMGVRQHLSFFLHTPFPSRDLFRRLPWNDDIMKGMLEYDHLGFQTPHDRRNFVNCVRWIVPRARIRAHKRESVVTYNSHETRLGFYPISIDFNEFNNMAKSQEVSEAAWFVHENVKSRALVLGLDRLDYTKGIEERFRAFERMLEKYPDTHEEVSLIQVVVPSRLRVEEYQTLKESLDRTAGRINGRFSRHGWVPIHYMFRSLDRVQLLGHYRACEIALITPLRDGMNLVAKEYCASSVENNGVLILSEFAGAAQQLAKGAIMVNPYDVEGTAEAIYHALIMDSAERQRRMKLLRAEVKRNDVHNWVRWFIADHMKSNDHSPWEYQRTTGQNR